MVAKAKQKVKSMNLNRAARREAERAKKKLESKNMLYMGKGYFMSAEAKQKFEEALKQAIKVQHETNHTKPTEEDQRTDQSAWHQ